MSTGSYLTAILTQQSQGEFARQVLSKQPVGSALIDAHGELSLTARRELQSIHPQSGRERWTIRCSLDGRGREQRKYALGCLDWIMLIGAQQLTDHNFD